MDVVHGSIFGEGNKLSAQRMLRGASRRVLWNRGDGQSQEAER
jgi:hypothetical protein